MFAANSKESRNASLVFVETSTTKSANSSLCWLKTLLETLPLKTSKAYAKEANRFASHNEYRLPDGLSVNCANLSNTKRDWRELKLSPLTHATPVEPVARVATAIKPTGKANLNLSV